MGPFVVVLLRSAWLIFGHASLNSRHFLALDLPSSLCEYADKMLIRLRSNLVGHLITGLPQPHFWSCSAEFQPFLGSDWSGISMHLPEKHWLDWIQIWWANSLQASPGLIDFWSCSAESKFLIPIWFNSQWETYIHWCLVWYILGHVILRVKSVLQKATSWMQL